MDWAGRDPATRPGRAWTYTLSDCTEADCKLARRLVDPREVSRHVCGREDEPPRLRGAIVFQTAMRPTGVEKLMPRAHWERAAAKDLELEPRGVPLVNVNHVQPRQGGACPPREAAGAPGAAAGLVIPVARLVPSFACAQAGCCKVFTKQSNLDSHVRVAHSGERFVCPHPGCGKALRHKKRLKSHLALHEAHPGREEELRRQRPKLALLSKSEFELRAKLEECRTRETALGGRCVCPGCARAMAPRGFGPHLSVCKRAHALIRGDGEAVAPACAGLGIATASASPGAGAAPSASGSLSAPPALAPFFAPAQQQQPILALAQPLLGHLARSVARTELLLLSPAEMQPPSWPSEATEQLSAFDALMAVYCTAPPSSRLCADGDPAPSHGKHRRDE